MERVLYPFVTADTALFSIDEDELKVLLVRRSNAPAKGEWALPGGALKPAIDTSLEDTARRVLRDKISVDIPHLEQVRSFSGPDRDARGWSISQLFYALLPRDKIDALVKTKVEAVEWSPVAEGSSRRRLAFDHDAQLSAALKVLRGRVEQHALPLHLLPQRFTLTGLQRTVEAILGHEVDKSAFRRRIKGSPDLVELDEYVRGAQRPAQLFRASDDFSFEA